MFQCMIIKYHPVTHHFRPFALSLSLLVHRNDIIHLTSIYTILSPNSTRNLCMCLHIRSICRCPHSRIHAFITIRHRPYAQHHDRPSSGITSFFFCFARTFYTNGLLHNMCLSHRRHRRPSVYMSLCLSFP